MPAYWLLGIKTFKLIIVWLLPDMFIKYLSKVIFPLPITRLPNIKSVFSIFTLFSPNAFVLFIVKLAVAIWSGLAGLGWLISVISKLPTAKQMLLRITTNRI